MQLFEVLKNIDHTVIQGSDLDIKNIVIDSREARKGSLFFCIKGLNQDARKYIPDAVSQGASAIMVDDLEGVNLVGSATFIKVENVRSAMAIASGNFYGNPYKHYKMIGVTGTNGKTSVTYFMEAIIREYEKSVGVIGTAGAVLNGEKLSISYATSTTPDPIELHQIFKKMHENGAEYVVMEATSHAFAFNKLDGVRFDIGIFTNLSQDHLDIHGTMENYRDEKLKLFKSCDVGVLNIDDDYFEYMRDNGTCRVLTYGIDKECDFRAENIEYLNNGSIFDINIDGDMHSLFLPVAGRFSVYNALAVIGTAVSIGIPIEVIKRGLENMKGVPGRIQSVPNDLGFNVVIDYAHTPDALVNIISAVRGYTKGRIITVFGCGGDRDKAKRSIMGQTAGELSDYCIATSDNPRTEDPVSIINDIEPGIKNSGCLYEKIIDRYEAIARALEVVGIGDSVIIAGKGHENYQIFADQTIHFDDYEIASKLVADKAAGR
ncbi:MAG: UDP-N-acetylmuramoyl-L-alanyl-D-glutamate--2,6-diaminopimelate ligase [Defluviitaleaceae bacterium]|nr:UDP-N-acetylmuramoyl-L-alanyl-D-glutamate--2,6-diaminopimelate ligase [Defluviitaleaceae bacterium]